MYKEDTILDILESERAMILNGARDFGDFFVNASEFNSLLNNFINSIDDSSKFIFIAFLSQVKKHHTLALFSSIRRHQIQAGMNLRQTFEAGAWAAYAMAHKEREKFCDSNATGILVVPDRLQKARNKWLDQNFKTKSDELKRVKKIINDSVAHANIIYTSQNFEVGSASGPRFEMTFFDSEDDFIVKSDLWFVSNTAMGLLDLFYGANRRHKVFKFVDNFESRFSALIEKHNLIKAEMMKSERFKTAIAAGELAQIS
jgi:hypothetical protein